MQHPLATGHDLCARRDGPAGPAAKGDTHGRRSGTHGAAWSGRGLTRTSLHSGLPSSAPPSRLSTRMCATGRACACTHTPVDISFRLKQSDMRAPLSGRDHDILTFFMRNLNVSRMFLLSVSVPLFLYQNADPSPARVRRTLRVASAIAPERCGAGRTERFGCPSATLRSILRTSPSVTPGLCTRARHTLCARAYARTHARKT